MAENEDEITATEDDNQITVNGDTNEESFIDTENNEENENFKTENTEPIETKTDEVTAAIDEDTAESKVNIAENELASENPDITEESTVEQTEENEESTVEQTEENEESKGVADIDETVHKEHSGLNEETIIETETGEGDEIITDREEQTEDTTVSQEEKLEVEESSEDVVKSIIEKMLRGLLGEEAELKAKIEPQEEESEVKEDEENEFDLTMESHIVERIDEEDNEMEEEAERIIVPDPIEVTEEEEDQHGEEGITGKEGEGEEDKYEYDDEEPQMTKEEVWEEYVRQMKLQHDMYEVNTSLQHKLGDYLRKKKAAEPAPAQPIPEEKGLIDYEEKYEQQLKKMMEMEAADFDMTEEMNFRLDSMMVETQSCEETLNEENAKIKTYRQHVGEKSLNSRTGKNLGTKEFDVLFGNEEKKERVLVETRLESIKLQNEVTKIEVIIKSKEELADGLHLIDFEQFKIENQSYNEKLEERSEEIMKLRKKIVNNVHMLTHVKEKLEFSRQESGQEKSRLADLEAELTGHRDHLGDKKQRRDGLRAANEKMKKSCGMLGSHDLLRNYEVCVDGVEMHRQKLLALRHSHTSLGLQSHTLQMKIDNARSADNS